MNKSLIAILVLLSMEALIHATSSGLGVYVCDVYDPRWGCNPDLWNRGNRKECANETNLMSWATWPSRTDDFQLWLGEEELGKSMTSYTPNQYLTVGVSSMVYGRMYRGILLYAEDAQGNKVGEWVNMQEAPQRFHMPYQDNENDPCYNVVLQAGASEKHYLTRFKVRFTNGTGRITFRALIKEGDANVGDFWWPNLDGDLSLTEGSPVETDQFPWKLTSPGQSCEELCIEEALFCDRDALRTIKSEADQKEILEPYFPCRLPRVSACSFGPAASNVEGGLCFYSEDEDYCESDQRTFENPTCDRKSDNAASGRQFCKCTVTQPPAEIDENETEADSATGRLSVLLSLLIIPLFLNGKIGMSAKQGVVLVIVIAMFSGVQSHNWINSNSRTVIASTYAPCLPKQSPVPHIQVGKDQPFQIEWMTGHSGRETYLILINADNFDNLTQHTFRLLNDYIANADTPNLAQDALWQKLHRRSNTDGDYLYNQRLTPDDPEYLARPEEYLARVNQGQELYTYNASNLLNDYRYEYHNPNYPWIISVAKFVHSVDLPSEYDVARFVIPNDLPAGNYIVQYMWAGYYDCIDVNYVPDLHEHPANPVEYPYGLIDEEAVTTFSRIDHCYFPDINTQFYGPSAPGFPVIDRDPSMCIEKCKRRLSCNYVQVVPKAYPEDAHERFSDWHYLDQTMMDERYNVSYADILSDEWPYDYLCYDLEPRAPTQTQGRYVVTEDPNDPYFYSTCYVKNEKRTFIGFEKAEPAKIVTPWRFGDKCISCEDHQEISSNDYLAPIWRMTDKCVDCNAEPKPEKEFPIEQYFSVRNDSYCDGLRNDANTSLPDNYLYPHHKTCTATNERCTLRQFIGLTNERNTLNACAAATKADPQCSDKFMFYISPSSTDPDNYESTCYCWSKSECCHECTPRASTGWSIYELKKESTSGDPRCENGQPSPDFKSCCSAECGHTTQCRPGAGNRDVVGFCCSDCIFDRPCSQFEAPCTIDDDIAAELFEADQAAKAEASE